MRAFGKGDIIPVITGPTGSGKTALSLPLAKALGGAVISCDSMQIYKGLDIGTAKAGPELRAEVPHYLLDIREPDERFSVQDFLTEAEKVLQKLEREGTWPIFVGGTPQYVTSLVEGIRFMPGSRDPELRAELEERIRKEGGERMLRELAGYDPEKASKLHPNDHRRIVRALEIALTSGRRQSDWDTPETRAESRRNYRVIALKWPRDVLYERINQRVDEMFAEGILEEAKYLRSLHLPDKATSLQAIGYKELFSYLDGEISLEEAKEHLKRQSRRYAKRQLTWFRAKDWITWIDPERTEEFLPRFTAEILAGPGGADESAHERL